MRQDITGERLGRGTKITLWLKEDQLEEYLEECEIKDIMSYDEAEPDEAEKKDEDKINMDEQADKDDEEKPEDYV
ncbi:hypothetical protein GJ496_009090 [Pomphorhynchus laevis]|nr:hypothetical protein GJ496_009090 [Pomphorhynchus laevis]